MQHLARTLRLAWIIVAVLHVACTAPAQAAGSKSCRKLLKEYYRLPSSRAQTAPYTADNLLFFMHVPRTAGRMLESCLLSTGSPPARVCARGFRQLKLKEAASCTLLLSQHDDLSILQHLPSDAAVGTMLRDPVSRVLSFYEFAVEQAATRLFPDHVDLAGSTQDIWPWSRLMPFVLADVKPKLQALQAVPLTEPGVWVRQKDVENRVFFWNEWANSSKWELGPEEQALLQPDLDPYDNQVVMPLKEFIHHPNTTGSLHNVQLLQLLGLTSISLWPKAPQLRACMEQDEAIAEELLQFALKRLESFAFVGTTDELSNSVEAAAAVLHMPLDGPAYKPASKGGQDAAGAPAQAPAFQVSDEPLRMEYATCSNTLYLGWQYTTYLRLQSLRLPDRRQVSFDGDIRRDIPQALIEEIRQLNKLDAVLYARGKELLQRQRQQLQAAGTLQPLEVEEEQDSSAKPLTGQARQAEGGADGTQASPPKIEEL